MSRKVCVCHGNFSHHFFYPHTRPFLIHLPLVEKHARLRVITSHQKSATLLICQLQHNMAIAPITGTLRRKIITDITIGFGAGFVLATAYWYLEHKPLVQKREAFYKELRENKEREDSI